MGLPDSAPTPGGEPDARPIVSDPDAGEPDPMDVTLSHSTSTNVTAANSVACIQTNNATGEQLGHLDNSYYRVFDLASFGVTGDLEVTNVRIGIESATADAGSQPATIRLHTLAGPIATANPNLTLVTSKGITVPDQTVSVLDTPIAATIPAGSQLVVEFFTPDTTPETGSGTGALLFIGSNTAGQTAPNYLAAADCGVNQPTDTTAAPISATMHTVVEVVGTTR